MNISDVLGISKSFINILCIIISLFILIASGDEDDCEHFHHNDQLHKMVRKFDKNPTYMCFHGYNDTSIWAIWSDVVIRVETETKESVKFIDQGQSCKEVVDKYNVSSCWVPSFESWLSLLSTSTPETEVFQSTLPYNQHCFAISSKSKFFIEVKVEKLRAFYLVLMIIGIAVFFNADDISRNVLFYYSSGVSVGMLLSILLLIFIISRMIPKRSISYLVLFSGSSMVLYILRSMKNITSENSGPKFWVLIGYFVVSGLVSFLYCYYRGPVTSERGYDIMRWCLQSIALFLVYYSVRCDKIAFAFVLLLISTRWLSCGKYLAFSIRWTWMPVRLQTYFNQQKLINMEEYDKEGHEETTRALKLLQEYCNSPDCDTWKTVSRLKSPKRFASFISGGDHVTEDEKRQYDEVTFDDHNFMTSDEDSDTELANMALDFTEINNTTN